MSEHRLRHGDASLRVTLARRDDRADAAVDDAPHAVARIAAGPRQRHAGAASQAITFDLDGRPVRTLVTRRRDEVIVAVDGHTFVFTTGDAAAGSAHGRAGSGTTLAPMPGKVIAVLVREGDTVDAGQGLVVIEAMKMESTLAAEIAGAVARVTVSPGDVVDGGAVLVEITPAA